MNRGELRTYARRLLAEVEAASSFWPDDTLNDFLNRGYEDVCVRGELLECWSEGSVIFVPNEVHNEYLFPRDILRVLRVYYRDVRLRDLTVDELERADPAWHTRVADAGAAPVAWAPGRQSFYLYPAPSETATGILKLRCIQTPAPMTQDGHEPEIPTGYDEAIAIAGAIRALTADRTAPENERALRRLEVMLERALAVAQSQTLRKGPAKVGLRDIRDQYPSTWRP